MDIYSKELQRIIRRIAEERNVDQKIVHDVVTSQFACVRTYIKKMDPLKKYFPYIRLRYLFVFRIAEGSKKYYTKGAVEELKEKENVYIEARQSAN